MDLKSLKSGSDIRGTALNISGATVDLTLDAVRTITKAFYYYMLNHRRGKAVAVGCDPRLSSPDIKVAVIDALTESGADTVDIGLCSTPAAFMMTQFESVPADMAVMITASHHPKDKNGLKFFDRNGGLSGRDIENILELASYGVSATPSKAGQSTNGDYFKLYIDHLIALVRDAFNEEKPLTGLKIVVDAGNGAGGFYAENVLKSLGADTEGSQFLEPDGNFPNHAPNPENAAAIRSISECVVKHGADLGIIFDTDVDRAAVIGDKGEAINRDALIALAAKLTLQKYPGATVVTDSVTSLPLTAFIEAAGGVHHRFKRGYRNVIDEAVRLNSEGVTAPLAIETSGHAAFLDNMFLDDGAYLATLIVIEAAKAKREGRRLLDLIDGFTVPLEQAEVRLPLTSADWKVFGSAVVDGLDMLKSKKIKVASDSREGVRLLVPALQGFVMLRQSVHDPVIVVNAESNVAGGVKKLLGLISAYVSAFSDIDVSALTAAL